MQFLLLAYDGTDPQAPQRRLRVREEHFKKIGLLKMKSEFLFGGAILDENNEMIGSMIVYDVPDRHSMDKILKDEPYLTNGVWEKIEIKPFRLARIE
jgi:uncharacterized protein YciI